MVNRIARDRQARILNLLVEGSSMRSITRIEQCSINTVTRLVIAAGRACHEFHNDHVREVRPRRVQCDEVWAFLYAKRKRLERGAVSPPDDAGDVWTWTALDPDTKLLISWIVSPDRDTMAALELMDDLRERTTGKFQLTTDGLGSYINAVEDAFGGDVDYAQLIKEYEEHPSGNRHPRYVGARKEAIIGDPNLDTANTSNVERHNLTIRMSTRRFTRRTNAFSKKMENHCYAQALFFTYYNWCRPHMTLTKRRGYLTSPAMAAGLTDRVYDVGWLSDLTAEQFPKPGPRGPYKKRSQVLGALEQRL